MELERTYKEAENIFIVIRSFYFKFYEMRKTNMKMWWMSIVIQSAGGNTTSKFSVEVWFGFIFSIKISNYKKAKIIYYYLFYSGLSESQRQVAMVSEMIHSASLIHDDVIDQSELRRGKPSVNVLFNHKKVSNDNFKVLTLVIFNREL